MSNCKINCLLHVGGGKGCGREIREQEGDRGRGWGWGGKGGEGERGKRGQDLKLWASGYGLVVSKKLTVFRLGLWDPFTGMPRLANTDEGHFLVSPAL